MSDTVRQDETPGAGLPVPRALAVEALVTGSSVTEAAAAAGVARQTVHRWLAGDPAFVAALNAAKQEHLGRVRGELRGLATDAVAVLREFLVTDARSTPRALRFKAALAVLKMVGADAPEPPGPTDAGGVRMDNLFKALGGL
jgi:hypothetical protein